MAILAALLAFALGGWGLWYNLHALGRCRALQQHGASAQGVVVAMRGGEGGNSYQVRFATERQEELTVWLGANGNYATGESVTLLYDPDRPRTVLIPEPFEAPLIILKAALSGAVILAGGLVLLIWK